MFGPSDRMATPLTRPAVLFDIVEEHFDELDFLLEQRTGIVFAPDWTAADLAEHDERWLAHLDGLVLAELHAVDLALAKLRVADTFAPAAAAMVLARAGRDDLSRAVATALEEGEPAVCLRLRYGLRLSPLGEIERELARIAASGAASASAAAVDVLAFQRRPVPDVSRLYTDEIADVRATAIAAAGRAGALGSRDLERALHDPEAAVRRAALESATRQSLRGAVATCRAAARSDLVALDFLGVVGERQDVSPLIRDVGDSARAAAAAAALGALGCIDAVAPLIEALARDALADSARAALLRILGPIRRADGSLEPLDAKAARAWWTANALRFAPDRRWQCGLEVTDDASALALPDLSLEARRDLYLGARARRGAGGIPDVELERPAATDA